MKTNEVRNPLAQNLSSAGRGESAHLTGPRSEAKRLRILEAAMRHFAERGYHATRIEDIATELSIAKGSVFQHFGNKEGLFLAAYKKAVASFSAYLDAPPPVTAKGFFETLRYWLERTDRLVRENWVPYRVALLGNYGTDLRLRQEINRFLRDRDPYGTGAFVRMGVERGEVRSDIDEQMLVSVIEWTVERFQDALLTEELDPGLFSRQGNRPEKTAARIAQFLELLRSAIATPDGAAAKAARAPKGARKDPP
jgi:AcrR family transcriptional regulator